MKIEVHTRSISSAVSVCYYANMLLRHVPMLFLSTVAGGRLRVDWSAESSLSDLALLGGSTRSGLSRLLSVPFEELDRYLEVPILYIQKLCVCVCMCVFECVCGSNCILSFLANANCDKAGSATATVAC